MTDPTLDGLRADFPVVVEIAVAWADMDALQHVNNTVFFRYFEIARIEYLERAGFVDDRLNVGIGPILASTQCRFRRPVTFPDRLLVGASTRAVSEDRFEMAYRVVSTRLGEIAAEGAAVVVAYDYRSGRKTGLPARVRDAIAGIEGTLPPDPSGATSRGGAAGKGRAAPERGPSPERDSDAE